MSKCKYQNGVGPQMSVTENVPKFSYVRTIKNKIKVSTDKDIFKELITSLVSNLLEQVY